MRRFIGMVLAGGLSFGIASAATAETLADALISAYKNSNLLEQNQAVLRAADEGVAQAVATLRPVVEYAAGLGYSRSRSQFSPNNQLTDSLTQSLSLTARMTVYDFGRGDLSVKLAQESVIASRNSLLAVEQDVLLDAVSAYIDVGLQTQTLALRQSNTRLITKELRATKDRFEVGEATRTDVAVAEALLAAAQASEQGAEGSVTLARERFLATVGHYPGRLAGLPKAPRLPKTLEEARAITLRTHPSLMQAQSQVAAAELQVAFAKVNFQPIISGSAGLSTNFEDGEETSLNQTLGLQMSQTIYSGGKQASVLREAIANGERAHASMRQTAVTLTENVGRAWSNISVASANIQSSEKQIRAAQAAFDGVREEADLGARTTLDVLDAEQDLLDAKFADLQARAKLYEGIYQLLSSMGLLTVDHLNLGIPTYDVEAYYDAVKTAPSHSAQGEALDRILKSIGN